MVYQWYPGHMTKARRMIEEDVKAVDLVIELLDARVPLASRNPDVDAISRGKSRLVLLNKSDLADDRENAKWLRYFEKKGIRALVVDSRGGKIGSMVLKAAGEACSEKIERDRKKGLLNRPIRAMVVGIPNVGKSTFINSVSGRAAAKTGNKPGVTKGKQWIRLNKGLELLDTPGILWPKFDDQSVGLNLALIGAINDEILDEQELAWQLLKKLDEEYPQAVENRYQIVPTEDAFENMKAIALKRGCLMKQGEPDTNKASRLIIDDFRNGRIGRITLEKCKEEANEAT